LSESKKTGNKISHLILNEKNFETALNSIRVKRGLKPIDKPAKVRNIKNIFLIYFNIF